MFRIVKSRPVYTLSMKIMPKIVNLGRLELAGRFASCQAISRDRIPPSDQPSDVLVNGDPISGSEHTALEVIVITSSVESRREPAPELSHQGTS